jgi:hypothetical protein
MRRLLRGEIVIAVDKGGERLGVHVPDPAELTARRLALSIKARDVVADVAVFAGGEIEGAADINFVTHRKRSDDRREVHCMKYTVPRAGFALRVLRIRAMSGGQLGSDVTQDRACEL